MARDIFRISAALAMPLRADMSGPADMLTKTTVADLKKISAGIRRGGASG